MRVVWPLWLPLAQLARQGLCLGGRGISPAFPVSERTSVATPSPPSPLCSLSLWMQGPGFSEQVAGLQAEVRLLKKASAQLQEDLKAAVSIIRAKDKQLELDAAKLRAAAATTDRLHVRPAGRAGVDASSASVGAVPWDSQLAV